MAGEVEDVERWRRAARRAVRLLGWHVRTGVTRHGIAWAVVEDKRQAIAERDAKREAERALKGARD